MIKGSIKKNHARIIGIMSGTSHDGADLAIVEIHNKSFLPDIHLIKHLHKPYSKKLKDEIRSAFNGDTTLICDLNFELGEFYAKGVLQLLEMSRHNSKDIDAIASHGQTIHHIPPSGKKKGSTLQIGEASVISERTGIKTISDFRTGDMAAGGQGAPLVPVADYMLFNKEGAARAVLNIGGIANVTIVRSRRENTVAFDTGPGNSLIDEAMRLCTKDRKNYDRNGAFARSGKVNKRLLNELSSLPFLKKNPPKSTGRELFGEAMVRDIFRRYRKTAAADIVATLTRFTVESIYKAIVPYSSNEVIVAGGGTKNSFLMKLLRDRFQESHIPVNNISEYGIPAEAKEAVSFAILGYLTLSGLPGNMPSATGAKREVILGKVGT